MGEDGFCFRDLRLDLMRVASFERNNRDYLRKAMFAVVKDCPLFGRGRSLLPRAAGSGPGGTGASGLCGENLCMGRKSGSSGKKRTLFFQGERGTGVSVELALETIEFLSTGLGGKW